ncbi:MAG: hypothetical protein QE487_19165 [Fluviicola sp.]|nr:hypothetical protein [Fluviicola sp.]
MNQKQLLKAIKMRTGIFVVSILVFSTISFAQLNHASDDTIVRKDYLTSVNGVKLDLIKHSIYTFLESNITNWNDLTSFQMKLNQGKVFELNKCIEIDSSGIYVGTITFNGSNVKIKLLIDDKKSKVKVLSFGNNWCEKPILTNLNRFIDDERLRNLSLYQRSFLYVSTFSTSKYLINKVLEKDSIWEKVSALNGSNFVVAYQLSSKFDSLNYVICINQKGGKLYHTLFLAENGALTFKNDIVRWNDNIEGFRLEKRKRKYFAILPEIP